jgi:hypothetical protein
MSPALRGGQMRDYDVVIAPAALESLLRLKLEARESLMQAIWAELKPDIIPAVGVTGRIRRREIYGYLIDYRNLRDSEKKRFDLRNGKLVVKITPVTKGLWDWFDLTSWS